MFFNFSLLLFLNRDKNFLFLFLSLIIGFYAYFYNTLILFVFFNLIFLYQFFKAGFKFETKLFLSVLLTFSLF